MKKILEVKNLKVSFDNYDGQVKAVRGVSFHLKKGETLALIGESGSGKTVTIKSILKLLKEPHAKIDSESQILYAGRNILGMDNENLNKLRASEIGIILQNPMTSLNPTMTIGDQVVEALRSQEKMSRKKAILRGIRLLESVDIPNIKKRFHSYPHEFSSGMIQRVMIAMAISGDPKIILADEPTSTLDVTIQGQVIELLSRLKKRLDSSILLASHDLGIVANFADRIQVMYAGGIVERGSKEEIFYQSKHPYTQALLKSIPRIDKVPKERLYSIAGTPPDLRLPLPGCAFAPRCEHAMLVCTKKKPLESFHSETHRVSCWLQHPDAPKINDPSSKEEI